ncbi:O-methyltransferase [Marinobacter sp. CA1]|uniref:O-methyltransferase n=1 Tax=Marinobacter sp. CA1 TaxID=2817656 RepID=UPI001D064982|nr:O-methyltransferase [Marinobacter sp. CA1]UDL05117.1 O-methyltransferase [Marinobacter sp. CA1]
MALSSLLAELETLGETNDARETDRARKLLNITRDTGELLAVLLKAGGCRRVLEVGTSNGYSTLWLASSLPADGCVVSLDSAADKLAMAADNLARAGLTERVELVEADAAAYLAEQSTAFDLVFLDADRSQYPAMAEDVFRLVRPGGLLVCDNVLSHADEVAPFLAAVEASGLFTTAIVPVGKGELVACRHPD